MKMSDDFFTGPWMVEYIDAQGEQVKRHITADYEVYSHERVLDLLKEVHPEWEIKKLYKVEKLPWCK
tara:strand:+ start:324 stop:524 length:201 start_codon:yes stop_codon:yes gene_type:complete